MKLVGASNLTIRFPFIVETLLAALGGAALATVLLWATVNYGFGHYLNRLILDQAFIGLSDVWAITPWMIVGMALLAVTTSWVTLWRYLRV